MAGQGAPDAWIARSREYDGDAAWLRRSWWGALALALTAAVGSAVLLRYEQSTPTVAVSAETYGNALVLHALSWLAILVAALIAMPTLLVRPGRGFTVLGFLALALWAVAVVGGLAASPRMILSALGASVAVTVVQLALALPANRASAHRPHLVAAIGGIAALIIVAIPLIGGKPPWHLYWLMATTVSVVATVPEAARRLGVGLATSVVAPCLVTAWTATAFVYTRTSIHLADTLAMLAPLPVTGGALVGGLLLCATRTWSVRRRFAMLAAVLLPLGTGMMSFGFCVLGGRGMPRRYLSYLPEFQPMQIFVTVAAVLAVSGGLVALASLRFSRRS